MQFDRGVHDGEQERAGAAFWIWRWVGGAAVLDGDELDEWAVGDFSAVDLVWVLPRAGVVEFEGESALLNIAVSPSEKRQIRTLTD